MTENKEAATETAVVYLAKLVSGKSYTYKGAVFNRDVERRVSEATKAYLEEHAFDDVTLDNNGELEIERRPKFSFRVEGSEPAAPARRRSRSAS